MPDEETKNTADDEEYDSLFDAQPMGYGEGPIEIDDPVPSTPMGDGAPSEGMPAPGARHFVAEQYKETLVINLGGSLMYSEIKTEDEEEDVGAPRPFELDTAFISELVEALKPVLSGRRVFIVTGGGKLARYYVTVARAMGANESVLDEIGIAASRMNARILASFFGETHVDVPTEFRDAVIMSRGAGITFMGGTHPGHTTDAVAAVLAEHVGADRLIIATDVDGIYETDPKEDPEAAMFTEVSAQELVMLTLGSSGEAGSKGVIDPLACRIIQRSAISTTVVNGKELENLADLINQTEFVGTTIITEISEEARERMANLTDAVKGKKSTRPKISGRGSGGYLLKHYRETREAAKKAQEEREEKEGSEKATKEEKPKKAPSKKVEKKKVKKEAKKEEPPEEKEEPEEEKAEAEPEEAAPSEEDKKGAKEHGDLEVSIEGLSDTVLDALEKALPGAEIRSAKLESEDGITQYELDVMHEGKHYEVEITPTGEIIEVEEEEEDDTELYGAGSDDDDDDTELMEEDPRKTRAQEEEAVVETEKDHDEDEDDDRRLMG